MIGHIKFRDTDWNNSIKFQHWISKSMSPVSTVFYTVTKMSIGP